MVYSIMILKFYILIIKSYIKMGIKKTGLAGLFILSFKFY